MANKRTFSAHQFNSNGNDKLTVDEICSIPTDVIFQWLQQGKIKNKGFLKFLEAHKAVSKAEGYSKGYTDGSYF